MDNRYNKRRDRLESSSELEYGNIKMVNNTRTRVERILDHHLEDCLENIWYELTSNHNQYNNNHNNHNTHRNDLPLFKFIPIRLIWIFGCPGSGKTELSRRIANYINTSINGYINVSELVSDIMDKNQGILNVYDQYYLLFKAILIDENIYNNKNGLIIDSFCRHPQHAKVVDFLCNKLSNLHKQNRYNNFNKYKPIECKFILLHINVSCDTSVKRQLKRGMMLWKQMHKENETDCNEINATNATSPSNRFIRNTEDTEYNIPHGVHGVHGVPDVPSSSTITSVATMDTIETTSSLSEMTLVTASLTEVINQTNNEYKEQSVQFSDGQTDNQTNQYVKKKVINKSRTILLKESDLDKNAARKRYNSYHRNLLNTLSEFRFGMKWNRFRISLINGNNDITTVFESVKKELDLYLKDKRNLQSNNNHNDNDKSYRPKNVSKFAREPCNDTDTYITPYMSSVLSQSSQSSQDVRKRARVNYGSKNECNNYYSDRHNVRNYGGNDYDNNSSQNTNRYRYKYKNDCGWNSSYQDEYDLNKTYLNHRNERYQKKHKEQRYDDDDENHDKNNNHYDYNNYITGEMNCNGNKESNDKNGFKSKYNKAVSSCKTKRWSKKKSKSISSNNNDNSNNINHKSEPITNNTSYDNKNNKDDNSHSNDCNSDVNSDVNSDGNSDRHNSTEDNVQNCILYGIHGTHSTHDTHDTHGKHRSWYLKQW